MTDFKYSLFNQNSKLRDLFIEVGIIKTSFYFDSINNITFEYDVVNIPGNGEDSPSRFQKDAPGFVA